MYIGMKGRTAMKCSMVAVRVLLLSIVEILLWKIVQCVEYPILPSLCCRRCRMPVVHLESVGPVEMGFVVRAFEPAEEVSVFTRRGVMLLIS